MAKPDNPDTFKPKSDMSPREAAEQDQEQTRRDIHRDEGRSEPVRREAEAPPEKGGGTRQ